jgi:DNA-binding transcriptional MerR regulator
LWLAHFDSFSHAVIKRLERLPVPRGRLIFVALWIALDYLTFTLTSIRINRAHNSQSVEAVSEKTKTYTISELAREFGVTSRALRLYEESGLLAPKREGTRRIYAERDRVRLRLVLRGKRLGWSLAEIRESFNLYDSSMGEQAQLNYLLEKLDARRDILETQKQDIELALKDLDLIGDNARTVLSKIQSGQNKLKAG